MCSAPLVLLFVLIAPSCKDTRQLRLRPALMTSSPLPKLFLQMQSQTELLGAGTSMYEVWGKPVLPIIEA